MVSTNRISTSETLASIGVIALAGAAGAFVASIVFPARPQPQFAFVVAGLTIAGTAVMLAPKTWKLYQGTQHDLLVQTARAAVYQVIAVLAGVGVSLILSVVVPGRPLLSLGLGIVAAASMMAVFIFAALSGQSRGSLPGRAVPTRLAIAVMACLAGIGAGLLGLILWLRSGHQSIPFAVPALGAIAAASLVFAIIRWRIFPKRLC